MKTITKKYFEKVEIRVGTVIYIQDYLKPYNSSYKIWVDFGCGMGIRSTISPIHTLYKKDDLMGKQIIGLVNIDPSEMNKLDAEFLLTGFGNENGDIVIVSPDQKVPNGARLF